MADIKFDCPECGGSIIVDASAAGKVANCPHCAQGIIIPLDSPYKYEAVVSRRDSPVGITITMSKVVTPPSALKLRQRDLFNKAATLMRQKNLDEAIRVLHEVFDLTRTEDLGMSTQELMMLGEHLALAERYEEAWDEYHKVANMYYTPTWPIASQYSAKKVAYDFISDMQRHRGKIEQAIAYGLAGYLLERVLARISYEICPVDRWNLKEGLSEYLKWLLLKQTPQQKADVKMLISDHLDNLIHPQPEILMREVFCAVGGQGDVLQFQV